MFLNGFAQVYYPHQLETHTFNLVIYHWVDIM